jgi:hypothetical protein
MELWRVCSRAVFDVRSHHRLIVNYDDVAVGRPNEGIEASFQDDLDSTLMLVRNRLDTQALNDDTEFLANAEIMENIGAGIETSFHRSVSYVEGLGWFARSTDAVCDLAQKASLAVGK